MYLSFYLLSLAKLADVDVGVALYESATIARIILIGLIVSAAAGIPVRLYLLAASAFKYQGLRGKFLKLFPFTFALDELWALAPFLIIVKIGMGLALAASAALLYLPFAQRSLLYY
jgi:cholera toxin transcriptional activator